MLIKNICQASDKLGHHLPNCDRNLLSGCNKNNFQRIIENKKIKNSDRRNRNIILSTILFMLSSIVSKIFVVLSFVFIILLI